MKVEVLLHCGVEEALFGLGLSYGLTSDMQFADLSYRSVHILHKLEKVATKLAGRGGGHNKFLRQIVAVLDITAPLYWWKQFDTYGVGTVKQSESTMHTLLKKPITSDCFENGLRSAWLQELEQLRQDKKFRELNDLLPQSWLQRRIVTSNYAVLQNIVRQRSGHKLREWQVFITALRCLPHSRWVFC